MTTLENSIIEQQPAGFSIGARLLYLLLAAVGVVLSAFVIITPFDLQTQAAFAVFCAVVFLLVNRFKTRMATLIIVMLSVLISTRYLWWRTTETLGFVDPFDMMFGYGLYAAAIVILVVIVGWLGVRHVRGRVERRL